MATMMITTPITINAEDLKITKRDMGHNETTVAAGRFPLELIDEIAFAQEICEGNYTTYELFATSQDDMYTITVRLPRESANGVHDGCEVVVELVMEALREARGVRRLVFDWKASPEEVMQDVALALEEHGLVVMSIESGIDEYWFDLSKQQY